jgi:DnaJ-class molecular chaperone
MRYWSAGAWLSSIEGLEFMMRDPYVVLGLTKAAGAEEIKRAYRKLAKKFHPDQNRSDPKAKEKFAEANAAYEILGDEKKRAQFDRGEIDAEGKPRFQGFEGFAGGRPGFEHFEFGGGFGPGQRRSGGIDPADIFAELFGGRGPGQRGQPRQERGEDVAASVTVPLADAVHGGQARVTLPNGRSLDVRIPAGIEDGKSIRLKGQGQDGPRGAPAGDAIVTVKIARHPFLRVDGRDLRLDLPLTLYEAVLGAKVKVPTLSGAVELAVPPGSNGGRTLRLRGKGVAVQGQPPGDLLVTLRIVLPDEADAELEGLMRRWARERSYDPRNELK